MSRLLRLVTLLPSLALSSLGLPSLGVPSLGVPATAYAGEVSTPMCARDEVVAYVRREVGWHSPYATLLPPTIAEWPGPAQDVVLCAVTVVKQDFDATKYRSASWSETQRYSVRWLHPGYEVTMGNRAR